MVREEPVEARLERRLVAEVGDADRAPADLVLVGRADAAAGGADPGGAGRLLAHPVEVLVQRQDEGRVLGDHQVLRADRHPLPPQLLDLAEERPGVEHHPVADDAELARPHDARGKERELVDRAVDDEGVPGVVAALEAGDHVGALGEPVDDLALALVAPLGAHDHHVAHVRRPSPLPAGYIVRGRGPKPRRGHGAPALTRASEPIRRLAKARWCRAPRPSACGCTPPAAGRRSPRSAPPRRCGRTSSR